jgi:hypothetical protein
METKEQLIHAIKKWLHNDNEIRALQKEILKRKTEKKKLSNELMDIMKNHEIDCFTINDGEIVYNKKNVKKPITQKSLIMTLSQYFNGDLLKASELNNYIMENREHTVKENIVRKIKKGSHSTNEESSIPTSPSSIS